MHSIASPNQFTRIKNALRLLLITSLAWTACRNDGEKVQEIREGGPNSDLIRNPVGADGQVDTNQLARIVFSEPEFDFGSVPEGEIVEHKFQFTNTGSVPLMIKNARSSCGCTVPKWPQDPIPPGGQGEILATFNTEARVGEQKKLVYVLANTYPNETKLQLRGNVEGRKN